MEEPEFDLPVLKPLLSKGESIITHIKVLPSPPSDRERNLRNISPVILQLICDYLSLPEIYKLVRTTKKLKRRLFRASFFYKKGILHFQDFFFSQFEGLVKNSREEVVFSDSGKGASMKFSDCSSHLLNSNSATPQ